MGQSLCLLKMLLQLTQTHVGMHKQNLLKTADLLTKNMQ